MLKTILTLSLILSSCDAPNKVALKSAENNVGEANVTNVSAKSSSTAEVTQVDVIGTANDYSFAVTVNSPDTGCDNYADWWEVVTTEGELLYRRVLLHSHVDEQPFERSGGTVAIPPQQEVIVRVHMSADGYSDRALKGSVESGFAAVTLPPGFALNLDTMEPLPENCAF